MTTTQRTAEATAMIVAIREAVGPEMADEMDTRIARHAVKISREQGIELEQAVGQAVRQVADGFTRAIVTGKFDG